MISSIKLMKKKSTALPIVIETSPSLEDSPPLSPPESVSSGRSESPAQHPYSPRDDLFLDVHVLAKQGKTAFADAFKLRHSLHNQSMRRAKLLMNVAEATARKAPCKVSYEGLGGVYAVSTSSGRKVAMFKPAEEEGFQRMGIPKGFGALREYIAYLLDRKYQHFSGVPATALAQISSVPEDGKVEGATWEGEPCLPCIKETSSALTGTASKGENLRLNGGRTYSWRRVKDLRHWTEGKGVKRGAVQSFVESRMGSLEDFGMPEERAKAAAFVPVPEVHKVAILDIRLFNTDRHTGNMLLVGDSSPFQLAPIDHGCILPAWWCLSEARFDWLDWPQTKEQLSRVSVGHILSLTPGEDAEELRELGLSEAYISTMRICTLVLVSFARRGLSLYQIGSSYVRTGLLDRPSLLEEMVYEAAVAASVPFEFRRNQYGEAQGELPQEWHDRPLPPLFWEALEEIADTLDVKGRLAVQEAEDPCPM